MSKKGSKYARKHNVNPNKTQNQDFVDEPFCEVIYDDYNFLDIFNSLPLTEQIKAYQVLKELAETPVNNASRAQRKLFYNSKHKLEVINEKAGLKMEDMLRYPLSTDEHHIIRMDCYGSVDHRPSHQLSNFYRDMLKYPLPERLDVSAYDLENAPMWKVFRQFRNFRNIEPQLKQYLSDNNINPNILKVMNIKDFSDLMFKTFRKGGEHKAFFTQESERNMFVKELVKHKADVIFDILDNQGYDHRYIHSLLNAMKTYGITDASHIIITETHFTEKALTDLKKAKIPVEDYAVGDKIPQDLVDYLFRHDQGLLIVARDENLNMLSSSDFPSFEVHHKIAVSESGKLPCLAQVNYINNFLLVESNIHQYVLHGYDKLVVQKGKEAYRARMEFNDPHLTFMAGFTSDEHISLNWRDYEDLVKKEKEDSKYLVSYEACLNELKENRVNELRTSKPTTEFDVNQVVQSIRSKYKKGKPSHARKAYLKKVKGIDK